MTLDLSIYLVTDSKQAAAQGRPLAEIVHQAVAGGVTIVQIREKDAPAAAFLKTVGEVAAVLPSHVPLLINDRIDIFLAARESGIKVDGVHLGQADLPVSLARKILGPEAVIGLSAGTVEELRSAAQEPGRVDYIGIGALHPTSTKLDAPPALSLAGFSALLEFCTLPAVAIGGVRVEDLPGLRQAGAAGAAVVSAICSAADPQLAARQLSIAWRGKA
ncbi:thiamine phosphate synthase [Psychromicrobium lacuslunae]|uniref:Thiamine-phosphate synthase n=1 Tax=Psychromicrobium lacuslunae TaxID=1618207 RepID=A0A0D4C0H3_9MICC|nr:thiamine phosphate synthase [Psychromicrobium lacuslunae]AJT42172.1 thiamine-phosphate diphosphorylase [Psychromicrobium lacuslunae]